MKEEKKNKKEKDKKGGLQLSAQHKPCQHSGVPEFGPQSWGRGQESGDCFSDSQRLKHSLHLESLGSRFIFYYSIFFFPLVCTKAISVCPCFSVFLSLSLIQGLLYVWNSFLNRGRHGNSDILLPLLSACTLCLLTPWIMQCSCMVGKNFTS